jgi:predicted enzyme related to lactoylglutathione lyase
MMQNRSVPPGTMIPVLCYDDVAKAIDWLCHAFGFTERLRTPLEKNGSIHHAQLAFGMGGVILTSPRAGQRQVSVLVKVDDVNRHHGRASGCGARIVRPPVTCPFGERQYTAEDLEGNLWTFSQSTADADPKDWGAIVCRVESVVQQLPRPRICYVEIPALDAAQSAAFYEAVFGWNIRHHDSGRPSFDDATGVVSGAFVTGRSPSREPGLLPYIWVDNIDATAAKVTAHGGKVVSGPNLDSPGGEWIAIFEDPAGNRMGLYQEGEREAS